jgi:tetratricopeptide (TPR) repeat protein
LDSTHIEKCLADINSALKINKELPEAQIALGFYYYYCKEDYQNAIKHFNQAADKDPENYQPLFYMALVYRKMGKWEESQKLIHRVIEFNPQEALHLTNIGMSYTYLRSYDSALIFHQKAIDNMPVWLPSYNNEIETMILQDASVAEARILRDSAIQRTGENLKEWGILFDLYERKYPDALRGAENSHPADFAINGTRYLYLGKINKFLDNQVKAVIYYDSARIILNNELINDPDNPRLYSLSGIAYAGSGNKEKAIEAGKNAVKLSGGNNLVESDMTINLAQIYTMVGEYDNAISSIEHLLRNPSCFSVNLLQIDPVWEPLADLPKYKTILREYSKK